MAEIKSRIRWDKELDVLPLYEVLSRFVREKKLTPGDAFEYAVHLWCPRKPEAIIAYTDGSKWLVNNRGEEISEE